MRKVCFNIQMFKSFSVQNLTFNILKITKTKLKKEEKIM